MSHKNVPYLPGQRVICVKEFEGLTRGRVYPITKCSGRTKDLTAPAIVIDDDGFTIHINYDRDRETAYWHHFEAHMLPVSGADGVCSRDELMDMLKAFPEKTLFEFTQESHAEVIDVTGPTDSEYKRTTTNAQHRLVLVYET